MTGAGQKLGPSPTPALASPAQVAAAATADLVSGVDENEACRAGRSGPHPSAAGLARARVAAGVRTLALMSLLGALTVTLGGCGGQKSSTARHAPAPRGQLASAPPTSMIVYLSDHAMTSRGSPFAPDPADRGDAVGQSLAPGGDVSE